MSRKLDTWDYALRIHGVTPKSVALARLGEYLKAYAVLLGTSNQPAYAGVVKGSARLRASIPVEHRTETRVRLLSVSHEVDFGNVASNDDSAIRARNSLADMLARDGLSGELEDREGAVILRFEKPKPQMQAVEPIVHDTGVIDGVVIALGGIDDTVHLRLLTRPGEEVKLTLRDLNEARKAARHFRGDTVRAHVHGTWKRTSAGRWEPHSPYLDRIEELSDEAGGDLLTRLSALPGNRWSTMADPQTLLRAQG